MRILITILLFSFNANAETYYISSAGSDAANGTTTGTSWQTIAKVNSSVFVAGDFILFKKGDVWNERLNPPSSGTLGSVITFGSYGTGVKPLITGFTSVAMNDVGGNVWTATVNAPKTLNTVFVDGKLRAKARYPNNAYFTFTSLPTTIKMITPHTATNYTGYGVVLKTANWVIDATKIASVNAGVSFDTLNFSKAVTYAGGANGGNGYFFQNHAALLDTAYEWSFDSTNNLLSVYKTTSPTVQVSVIDTLVYLSNKDYITFDGIKFTGSNKSAIELFTTTHITIQNCTFDSHGQNAITETYAASGSVRYTYVLNDTITNCLSGGVYTDPAVSDSVIGNYIKNIGIYPGMGRNGNGTYIGIYTLGLSSNNNQKPWIVGNTIDSCGYEGINFKGKNSLIKNNYVTNYGWVKQDGGGIYTFDGNKNSPSFGSRITGNVIRNGIGSLDGSSGAARLSPGIYLDATSDIFIDSNTIVDCTQDGIASNGLNVSVTHNTIYNTLGAGITHYDYYTNYPLGFTFKNNILYSPGTYRLLNLTGLRDTTEVIDSNYYFKPSDTSSMFYGGAVRSFTGWRSYYPMYDSHSTGDVPQGVTSAVPLLKYNTTNSPVAYPLTGTYIDHKGTNYTNTVTVQPFQSKLLFKAINDIIPTTPPATFIKIGGLIFTQ